MKVAILHPWFFMRGGSERVVEVIAGMFPEADIFTLFVDRKTLSPLLASRNIQVSVLSKLPFSRHLYRHLLALYPWGVESFDLSTYDLVISSCGPAMMGANVRQDAIHICYCHTPQRSWWDLYAEHQAQVPSLLRPLFVISAGWVRSWEFSAMQRVDHVIANSNFVADRIFKYFRRDGIVIHPPVNMVSQHIGPAQGDYYLTVGRLEKPKRVDLIIHACNQLRRKLIIVGTGKEAKFLKAIAGPTIEFRGYVADDAMPHLYADCRAFLFAAVEDFGIAPLEAQAYGRPVVALGYGGSLETVRVDDPAGRPDTGVFFPEQSVESVVDALLRFEQKEIAFIPGVIRKHAAQFSAQNFVETFTQFVKVATQPNIPQQPANAFTGPMLMATQVK